jgi:hypothetical protein
VPLHRTAAAKAAIAFATSRPWRLVELGLVNLPDAARAPQECQRHRSADLQQVVRPDLGHAGSRARPAGVALAGTAKASRRKEPIAPAGVIGRDDPRCVAARTVDMQLKAVAGDVADCLERKVAKHASDLGCGRSRITGLH